jgi:hypothetical protein
MTGAAGPAQVPLGYESLFVVKNTFLETASVPPPEPLSRSQTAPPRYANVRPGDEEGEDREGDDEQPVEAQADVPTPAHVSPEPQPGQGWHLPPPVLLQPPGAPLAQQGDGPLKPQSLQMSACATTGRRRLEWIVDSRKLRGNDKQAVSPTFNLACGCILLPFKLMIYPNFVSDRQGGGSFKRSCGRGSVTLKCEADLTEEGMPPLTYRNYIGSGATAQPPRAPVMHDFSKSAVSSLPSDVGEWHFSAVVAGTPSVFIVGLEVQ